MLTTEFWHADLITWYLSTVSFFPNAQAGTSPEHKQ